MTEVADLGDNKSKRQEDNHDSATRKSGMAARRWEDDLNVSTYPSRSSRNVYGKGENRDGMMAESAKTVHGPVGPGQDSAKTCHGPVEPGQGSVPDVYELVSMMVRGGWQGRLRQFTNLNAFKHHGNVMNEDSLHIKPALNSSQFVQYQNPLDFGSWSTHLFPNPPDIGSAKVTNGSNWFYGRVKNVRTQCFSEFGAAAIDSLHIEPALTVDSELKGTVFAFPELRLGVEDTESGADLKAAQRTIETESSVVVLGGRKNMLESFGLNAHEDTKSNSHNTAIVGTANSKDTGAGEDHESHDRII